MTAPLSVVLVTGLSGAGRTSTLKVLEDLGYEAVDNLPLSLMPALLAPREAPGRIAVGVDPRTRGFATDPLADAIAELEARTDVDLRVVFLDCDDDVLIRRFTETRRRHPLATDRPIADGIAIERRMLDPVRDLATAVIDTSSSNLSEFRESLISSLALDVGRAMTVTVVSFAFRSGLPREADLVFDVRFLANPHYMPDLRPRDGRDPDVGAFVAGDPGFAPFFQSLTDLIGPLLPRYEREGKSYLTVAIGCTGGKHRSVHVAERLAEWLKSGELLSRSAIATCLARRAACRQHEQNSAEDIVIGIVLVTHGRLADELKAVMEHVVGPQTGLATVCIGPEDDMEQRRGEIMDRAKEMDAGDGVIVLTDMFGGTPSNLAISIIDRPGVEVIAGVNLPMLIKLASVRANASLHEASVAARDAGRKYISIASEVLGGDRLLSGQAMATEERKLLITNKRGLHARAAAKFVKCAGAYAADIEVEKDGQSVSGRSIMGLMMLAAAPGCSILVRAKGSDAGEAMNAIAHLVESKFDEDH